MMWPTVDCHALVRDRRGAALLEYVVALALVAGVCIGGFRAFGMNAKAVQERQAACIAALGCAEAGTPGSAEDRPIGRAPQGATEASTPSQTDDKLTLLEQPARSNTPGTPLGIADWLRSWFQDLNEYRFEKARELLQSIPEGREVLKDLDSNKVTFRFADGEGTYFSKADNRITVDVSTDVMGLVHRLAHEGNHARTYHAGTQPDPRTAPRRTEFVEAMIQEEVAAIAREARVLMQLAEAGHEVRVEAGPARDYLAAHELTAWALTGKWKTELDAETDRAAHQAALNNVVIGIRDGQYLSSVDGRSARSMYGAAWDRHHRATPEPPPAKRKR